MREWSRGKETSPDSELVTPRGWLHPTQALSMAAGDQQQQLLGLSQSKEFSFPSEAYLHW